MMIIISFVVSKVVVVVVAKIVIKFNFNQMYFTIKMNSSCKRKKNERKRISSHKKIWHKTFLKGGEIYTFVYEWIFF